MARFSVLLLATLMLFAGLSAAQDMRAEFAERLGEIERSINAVEAEFREDMSESRVAEQRTIINERAVQIATLDNAINDAIARVESDINALGPVPEGEGEVVDPLQSERANLNLRLNALKAQAGTAAILSNRIEALQSETSIALREAFLSRIFKRESLPFSGNMAETVTTGFSERLSALMDRPKLAERQASRPSADWLWLLFGIGLLIAPAFMLRDMIARRVWDVVEIEGELAASRAVTALVRALRRIIVAAVALFILVRVSDTLGVFAAIEADVAVGAAIGIFYTIVANALAIAILSPRRSAWRLVRLNNADAMQTYRRLRIGYVLMGIYITVLALLGAGDTTGPLANAVKFTGLLGFAAYFIYLARWTKPGRWRFVAYVIAVLFAGCALLGYFALGDNVLGLIANFSIFLAGLYVIRQFLRNWAALAVERLIAPHQEEEDGRVAKSVTKTGDAITFWTGAGVDMLLLIAATPLAMALAGVPWSEIWALIRQFLVGFEVFGYSLSPINIVYGLLVFIGLLLATRLIQRMLNTRILPQAGVEAGLRNTLSTLFGYVGLVVAGLVGIQALGINLGNVALIAGALSVGIGFGLTSIVNNFVSGLILLLERPIKIDDWVVTNSGEGRVKRINVRSTEIETFDKCSIIVPNSELISSSVSNWTHKDRSARITVPVGVAYHSDPAHVRDVLYSVLDDVPGLLRYPEPYVYFKDFGASSLDMEVRVFVREANDIIRLRSELRYRIFAAFKAAGIEIPFPQHDINFKNAIPAPVEEPDVVPETVQQLEGGAAGTNDVPTGVRPKVSKTEPSKVDIEKEVKSGQDATPDDDETV